MRLHVSRIRYKAVKHVKTLDGVRYVERFLTDTGQVLFVHASGTQSATWMQHKFGNFSAHKLNQEVQKYQDYGWLVTPHTV